MENIVQRAQITSNIIELHKEVYILETELELLLMKTYPTLINNYVKSG